MNMVGEHVTHTESGPPARIETARELAVTPAATGSAAYGSDADRYEQRTGMFQAVRDQLVDRLPVRPGDTVLDVGCGTGLCLPALAAKVGAGGTVIGIDPAPDMLEHARRRVAARGWPNVQLIESPIQTAQIPAQADAVLFCATHDVLQSPAALANVRQHLRPGAGVAAGGGKWPSRWLWGLRIAVTALHTPYVQDFTGFDRPWRLLGEQLADLHVQEMGFGAGYLAVGRAR